MAKEQKIEALEARVVALEARLADAEISAVVMHWMLRQLQERGVAVVNEDPATPRLATIQ